VTEPAPRAPSSTRPLELVATAVGAGALGALVGLPFDLALPFGVIAAANGAICGWRGTYDWRTRRGWSAAVLDSTWSLVTTTGALVSHAAGYMRGDVQYVDALSHRQNRIVYQRGLRLRRGFAVTIGNVVSGAGDVSTPRRQSLVTHHEDVHVWQARWFGPLYPVIYVGWTVIAGAAGAVVWATRRRDERFTRVVETCAYYANPFEWWAYSRDGRWPPHRMVSGLGWRRPMVRPFDAAR
jgi:hypothetical protein